MNDKLIPILLFVLLLSAIVVDYAIWSAQTGIPIADILLFRI